MVRLDHGSLWGELATVDVLPLLRMCAKHPSFECRMEFGRKFAEVHSARDSWMEERQCLERFLHHSDPDWIGDILNDTFESVLVYLGPKMEQEIHLVYPAEKAVRFADDVRTPVDGSYAASYRHMGRAGLHGGGVFDFLIRAAGTSRWHSLTLLELCDGRNGWGRGPGPCDLKVRLRSGRIREMNFEQWE
jgi:hypothetical protein